MVRFLTRLGVLLAPFMLLGAFFVLDDPMRVGPSVVDPVKPGVVTNDRVVSTRFLSGKEDSYDSFVFGSSRSKALYTEDWCDHLEQSCAPFHFGVNDESLYGVERKLNWLDEQDFRLRTVLIQVDHRLLSLTQNPGAHIFREHWKVSGEQPAEFYKRFVTAFLQPDFLRSYMSMKRRGLDVDEIEGFFWDPGMSYLESTGDVLYTRMDSMIRADSVYYYQEYRSKDLYTRKPDTLEPVLGAEAVALLNSIASVLRKHGTDFRVVVSPNYDQQLLSRKDQSILEDIFGIDRVHNYSGVSDKTENVGNYYEHKHFKPYIWRQILREIY